jgi:signal transduction histidine kinase
VAKHAGASRVGLTLSYLADLVTLDIRDDGVGFDPDGMGGDGDGGFGLTVRRQRVGRLAGTLEIESEPGAGTAVFAGVPAIPREAPDA